MRIYLLFIAFITGTSISAQNKLPIDSMMRWYESERMPERMHIHFDKAIYTTGQTIFFKSYLLAGTEYTDASTNLYIDFFGDDGQLLQQTQWPVLESAGWGNFTIPKEYAGEFIQVKAYTRWMLNFDSSFIYRKNIPIALTKNNYKKKKEVEPITTIRFFPEGGYMINNLTSKIAFAVRDQFGYPVSASGHIVSNTNDTVGEIKTIHDGMGAFYFIPDAEEEYFAIWQDEFGNKKTTALPTAIKDGISTQLKWYNNNLLFVAESTIPQSQKITVRATMQQQIVYKASFQVEAGKRKQGQIITNNLPSGIMLVTFFNEKDQAFAERTVFVNNQNHLINAQIVPTQTNTEARGQNDWEISIPDSIPTQFSIAITDEGIGSEEDNNIVSQLLLSSEMRSYIHKPAYYFSNDSDSTKEHLDLLLLTQGWRKINWQSLAMGYKAIPKYPKETEYLMVNGKVIGGNVDDYRAAKDINLILVAKDSSKQIFSLPINPDGSFSKNQVLFYDTVKVYYQFNKYKRLENRTTLQLNNGLMKRTDSAFSTLPLPLNLQRITTGLAKAAFFAKQEEEQARFMRGATLENVTVFGKTKTRKEVLNENYTSGLFRDDNGQSFDIMNETAALGALNVFQFLQGRVAGLQIGSAMMGSGAPTITWRGDITATFLDEMQVSPEVLMNIPINDIAYVKTFRPPFFGAPLGGAGGAIAVYTKKGKDAEEIDKKMKGLNFLYIPGYTPLKEFYSPDYATTQPNSILKDVRSTLYWNATKRTDRNNNKVLIHFYNNDVSKSYRIIIEGMNELGKLLRYEKVIGQ